MKGKIKQFLALLLVFVLLLGLIPSAYAATDDGTQPATEPIVTEAVTEPTLQTEPLVTEMPTELEPTTTQSANEAEPADEDEDTNAGIATASANDGIMLLSGSQLSGVKLLNLASPYNYTCTLSSQVYVKYVPAGTSTAKTAGLQNIAWHYYSYNGVQDKNKTIYCIEPYKDYNQGSSGNYMDQGVDVWGSNSTGSIGSNAWYALSSSQRSAIAYTLLFSEQRWDDSYDVTTTSKANNPNYSLRVATQVLIYEIVTGLRDPSSFARLSSNGYSAGSVLYDAFKDAVPDFRTYYNGIVSDVQNAELLPSFCSSSSSSAPTITVEGSLTWVTDSNGVCGQFTFVEDNDDIWFNVYDTEVGFQNPYGFTGTKLYSCYKSRPSTSSTFSVFYGTSSTYQSCIALHSAATSRTTGYFNVYVPASTGDLSVTKTTSDGQNLSGWQFSLYSNSACTSLVAGPYTTNSSGKVSFSGLNPGTYYVKEVGHTNSATAAKYTCTSTNPRSVTISAGSTSSVSFTNTLKPGTVSIKKTTSDGKNLAGWQFSIYSNSACTTLVSGPHTTDSSGNISAGNIPAGTVYVKEVGHQTSSIASQYTCSSTNPQAVTVTAGGTSSVSFTNTLRQGTLNITKTTEDSLSLSGWPFSIYSDAACTTLVSGPHNSNTSGKVTIQLDPGTYYVKELSHGTASVNTKYYCASTNPQTVTITAGGTASVTFQNKLVTGTAKIMKVTNTGNTLSGWKFNIYTNSARTQLVSGSPFTTATDGSVSVRLAPGTYYIQEVNESDTKPDWTFDTSVKTVTVTANETATVSFSNTHYGYARIMKETNTGNDLSGWKFNMYTDQACTDLVAGSPFTSGEDGTISVRVLPGEYYIKEVDQSTSKPDWDFDTEVKKVVVTAGATGTAVFNNCHFGYAEIIKETSTGQDRAGWKFNIYEDETCTTLVPGSPFTSDTDGKVIARIEPGKYYIQEVNESEENPDWIYDTTVKEITVEEGKTASVTFSNTHCGYVEIQKQTNTGKDLGGWKFHIYSDPECTKLVTGSPFTSSDDGTVKVRLVPGIYFVSEVDESKEKPGWIYDDTIRSVTVEAGKTAIVKPENTQLGQIKIIKSMPNGGDLAGWIFDVHKAEDNSLVGTFTSQADGTITTDYLLPGDYIVTEKLDEDSIYICVDENPQTINVKPGETGEVTFTNSLKPGKITVTKTDITGAPLPGAEFLLEWSADSTTWKPVVKTDAKYVIEGTCTNPSLKDGKLISPENGVMEFTGLHPEMYYRLTETKAPDGYQLLEGHAFEGKLRPEMDFSQKLTVVNANTFNLPKTGSRSMILMPVSLFLALTLCCTLLYWNKRKNR